jgi:hypothetical protein
MNRDPPAAPFRVAADCFNAAQAKDSEGGARLGAGLGRNCIRLGKFWDWQMVNFLSINPRRHDFRITGGAQKNLNQFRHDSP